MAGRIAIIDRDLTMILQSFPRDRDTESLLHGGLDYRTDCSHRWSTRPGHRLTPPLCRVDNSG